jgi:hypothetical protein
MEFIRLDANLYLETNAELIRVEPMVEGVTLYLSRCPTLRSIAIATTKHSVIEADDHVVQCGDISRCPKNYDVNSALQPTI